MKIKVLKLDKNAIIPSYAHAGDAGMDFYSLNKTVVEPQKRVSVSTGIVLEIPKGYVGLIWDKSGLAVNNGIKTMAGVIDSGYRGEIQIIIFNTSQIKFIIEKGDRIAQILIQKIESPELVEVNKLFPLDNIKNTFML